MSPAAAGPGIEVDVHAEVGAFHLDARFEVGGGTTVLFGPSGAGKTRTLRLLAGLDTPVRGRIAVGGRVLYDHAAELVVPAHERHVGMVFQQPLLLPHRTARANVALAVRDGDRHTRREVAEHWLRRVEAVGFADRRPAALSGGQQQRVALARALAGDPALLLLDEPFSALDLPVRRRLRTLVRELVEASGVPTLFVTHDPDEVTALADRVVLADHGSITRLVTPAEAIRHLGATG